jgi:hypothetical protein
MSRRVFALLVVLTLLVVSFVLPQGQALASVYNGTVIFSCTDANATGTGSHVLDRDNTGAGQERLRVDIFDGAGTLIFTITYQNLLGTYGAGIGIVSYTTPPQYNPLTFVLTSLAGNSLPEQVDFTIQGQCPGLPTFVPSFRGPGLPAVRDLVLMTSDAAVLDAPGGNPTGRVIRTCQTAFVLETSGNYARVFVMGGWVPVSSFVVVDPTYGQPGGAPIYPPCVGR